MRFESHGIHTRIKNLIKNKTNGIDPVLRKKYLKEKYNIKDEDLNLIYLYDIDNLLDKYTIEELVKIKKEKLNSDEKIINKLFGLFDDFKEKYML